MKVRRRIPRRLFLEALETRLVPSITTSTNWSGYAVQAKPETVTSVVGSWVVPKVSGTGTAYSSTWVGIDGYSSNSVEQIGTDSDLSNGKPVYYAWYEMYPSVSVNISMTVQPGDSITAKVSYASNGFTLKITDQPTVGAAETFSITQTGAGLQRSSAEWIEEAPSSNSGVLPLANFGTVGFTGAQATIGGTTGPINSPAWTNSVAQINMVSGRGATETTTGALTDSGSSSSFAVKYVSNGSSGGGGGGKGHGSGFRATNLSAQESAFIAPMFNQTAQQATTPNQTTQQAAAALQSSLAAALLNQVAQQTSVMRPTTTQPIIAFPSTLGAASSLPAFNSTLLTPVPVAPTASANLSSLFGPARASLNSPFASSFPSSGGNGGQEAPPEDAPVKPPPMVNPGDKAADPALELSDACFMEGGNALAAPVNAAADPTEEKIAAVDGAVDALFALALGGFVGIAVEKRGDRRRRMLRLR